LSFRRELGRFDTTMVVVGGIIGAGIFINPYIVAQRLDSFGLVLGAWLAGGVVALAGALTFAELGALMPDAGGHYAYLRDAYHPLVGFLYGWGLLLMIESGAIAAVAITFAGYTLRLVGHPGAGSHLLAILGIVVMTAVNYLGVKPGSRVLNAFVLVKMVPLALLIVAGLLLPAAAPGGPGTGSATTTGMGAVGEGAALAGAIAASASPSPHGLALLVAFGAGLVPVMFSYGGWQNANYVAEEMKEPVRDLPVSLMAGTALVVLVYGSINFVYLKFLGHDGLAATTTPASDVARSLFGPTGNFLVTLGIVLSTFGFLDLAMLAPTRVYYAMARDGLFPERVARLHPRFASPSVAIFIQSAWAIVLVLSGTYAALIDYVTTADWTFFSLAAASLFVFRRKVPLAHRPAGTFAAPGYPLIPGLFLMVALLIVGSVAWSYPARSGIGFGLLALGVPAYLFWSGRTSVGAGGIERP
jgi:basic amino acid/polyamine antiporter, APA family